MRISSEAPEAGVKKVTVPDLSKACILAAETLLRKLGLTAVACPFGNEEFEVIDQYPKQEIRSVGNSVCLYSQ